ncbi:hypothetical protein D3C74_366140 [compost metagenome]
MLGVGHDRVRAEVREVLGLRGRVAERCQVAPAHGRAAARAALVEQDHAVRREHGPDPPLGPGGPWPLAARAALEEHEQGQVLAPPDRVDQLAHEDRDPA